MSNFFRLFMICLCVLSCSKSKDSSTPSPKALYATDIQNISTMTYSKSLPDFNYFSLAFLKVFGGTGSQDVTQYLAERVKVVLDESEVDQARIESEHPLTFVSWLSETTQLIHQDDDNHVTVAANVGSAYALLGAVNGTVPTLVTSSGRFPLASTRDGVIALTKNYAPTYVIQEKTMTNHLLGRLSIVIHEARHSDCTGGFSIDSVNAAQSAQSIDDFLEKLNVPQIQCGHLHVKCPENSQLAGVYACDKSVWNAYGVQAIYLLNAAINSNLSPDEIEDIENQLGSALYRLPENFKMLMETTSPDMSHTEF